MGCIESKEEEPPAVERKERQRQHESQEVKLLLLGAGESGKSTVLKQLKLITNHGFTIDDRRRMVPAVHNHIVSSIRAIAHAMVDLGIPMEDPSLRPELDHLRSIPATGHLSVQTVEAVQRLRQDRAWRQCIARANEFQLNDNTEYFLDHLDAIAAPDYVPSEQDVIRTRIQTTGIFETTFEFGQAIFHMYDVGGQRSERRKWLLCFSDVTAVLFVVAISSYDQHLHEDRNTNRLREAITLFESIWENKYLKTVSVILLLNKIDLLAAKLKNSDMSKYFPEYTGGSSYAEATKFIQSRFVKVAKEAEQKRLYTHFICAVDTEIVHRVFTDIKNMILTTYLHRYGIV